MPDPKTPTSAEKLTMLRVIGQRLVAAGQPPSPQVQVALRSFGDTAPTPEEIERVANDLIQSGNVAAAVEFQAYAETMSAATNQEREAAQSRFDAGVAPSPPVVQALNSFDAPPTPEQISTIGKYLRKTHGDAVGQEFETYAASAVAEQAQLPPTARPDAVRVPARQASPQVSIGPAQIEERQIGSITTPGSMPPGAVSVDIGRARDVRPQVSRAGMVEPELVQRAKDVLQGTGHILSLGAVPAPESIKSGNDRLRGMVGLEPLQKKPRQGKTEVDKPRDKNKERDLLNEAKRIDADPR